MVRCPFALRWSVVLGLALIPVVLIASPPADESGFQNSLALQQAMESARHHLLQAESLKAVEVLEEQLARVNGHAPFLRLLREAYRTHIKHLWLANQPEMARKYLERLCILDPGAGQDAGLRPPETVQTNQDMPASKSPAKPPQIFPNFAKNHGKADEAKKKDVLSQPTAVRAKVDDPFDISHQRQPDGPSDKSRIALQLLSRAEAEFGRRRYPEAQALYDQVYQADPEAINPCRERWAYCMLTTVVERLNSPKFGGQSLADLEQQVHAALALAPKLDPTGKSLLKEIEQRARPQVTGAAPARAELVFNVQHYDRNAQGWYVTETTHFRIFHQQQRELADKVAQVAERTSLDMTRKWLAQETLAWTDKCEVVLYGTKEEYLKQTGVPSHSPGHAHIESDTASGRVLSRRLYLRCDHADMLNVTLPHETTHVVLAGHFDQYAVPRWADEGVATLSEPQERLDKYRRALSQLARTGHLFTVRELLTLEQYPDRRRIDVFYAQSVSLVEFLTQQRDPMTLTAFVRDGLRQGYEASLQKHYGWNLDELQMRWQQRVLGEGREAQSAQR